MEKPFHSALNSHKTALARWYVCSAIWKANQQNKQEVIGQTSVSGHGPPCVLSKRWEKPAFHVKGPGHSRYMSKTYRQRGGQRCWEHMIQTASTLSWWPGFTIVPELCWVWARWLESQSFSPLHWRVKWTGARKSRQSHTDHCAECISRGTVKEGTEGGQSPKRNRCQDSMRHWPVDGRREVFSHGRKKACKCREDGGPWKRPCAGRRRPLTILPVCQKTDRRAAQKEQTDGRLPGSQDLLDLTRTSVSCWTWIKIVSVGWDVVISASRPQMKCLNSNFVQIFLKVSL